MAHEINKGAKKMSKWLNPKIKEIATCEDVLVFINLKYQRNKEDIEDMKISESFKKEGFVTFGYRSGDQFEDLIHREDNGEPYCYDMETVVAWMPLPEPPIKI